MKTIRGCQSESVQKSKSVPKRIKTILFQSVCENGTEANKTETYEYAERADVMVPEITSSSFFKSAMAARGRPQLAT